MSLPERKWKSLSPLLWSVAFAGLVLASACTVQPLYSDRPLAASAVTGTTAQLSSVSVKPVSTRYAQQVRNNLIFLFNGGKGEPESPVYVLDLSITRINQPSAIIQIADEDQPTAGTITLISSYRLTKAGEEIATGTRQVAAQFDVPVQEFAHLRAEHDAENRAARELAELLRLAIAQDLIRKAPL
jgi:LPS-assembly lipoprotein